MGTQDEQFEDYMDGRTEFYYDMVFLRKEFTTYIICHVEYGDNAHIEMGMPDIVDFVNKNSTDFYERLSKVKRDKKSFEKFSNEFLDSLSERAKDDLQFILEEEVYDL